MDFELISSAVYKGSHKVKEIKELILKLSYTMNNYRLTTNKKGVEVFTSEEREILKNATPTLERLNDGRLREIETGKIEIKSSQCLYEAIKLTPSAVSTGSAAGLNDSEALFFDTLKDTSKNLDVDIRKLKRCIVESMGD